VLRGLDAKPEVEAGDRHEDAFGSGAELLWWCGMVAVVMLCEEGSQNRLKRRGEEGIPRHPPLFEPESLFSFRFSVFSFQTSQTSSLDSAQPR
jgi:hypothetical protein